MDQHSPDLTVLRREHPAYLIDQDLDSSTGSPRYSATARDLATSPWCVVTHDPTELRAALAGDQQHQSEITA
ncbi:MAG TPA: hypothetical protein VMV17_06090 [Streptosporangiaceae bacterium]|nr:hypothetical protein [Streptosporangiaceae bacterium]